MTERELVVQALLDIFAHGGDNTVAEIARRTGLRQWVVARTLNELEEEGFAEHAEIAELEFGVWGLTDLGNVWARDM